MGFWSKLFGRSKSATSGAIAPEDGGSKPASEFPATEQPSAGAPPTEPASGLEESGEIANDSDAEVTEQPSAVAPPTEPASGVEDSGETAADPEPEVMEQPSAGAPLAEPASGPEGGRQTADPQAMAHPGVGAAAILLAVGPEDGGLMTVDPESSPEQPSASAPAPQAFRKTAARQGPIPIPRRRNRGASARRPRLSSPDPEPASSNGVRYLRTTHDVYPVAPQFQATKRMYRSQSREAALAFLKTQVVTEPLFYIEVETPDGLFAVDQGQRVFDGSGRFIEA